jgi:hypothetical protein
MPKNTDDIKRANATGPAEAHNVADSAEREPVQRSILFSCRASAPSADRRPNPDFASSLRHDVSDDAVDASGDPELYFPQLFGPRVGAKL